MNLSHMLRQYRIIATEIIVQRLMRFSLANYHVRGYADYAALTPVDLRVRTTTHRIHTKLWANPSSLYGAGVMARKKLHNARTHIARILKAHTDEIIFTASGTEANNTAVLGYVEALVRAGKRYIDLHIIVSSLEHQSVLACAEELERRGVSVTYINAPQGVFDMKTFEDSLRQETVLVSCMMVNNEIGIRLPIEEIVKAVRRHNQNQGGAFPCRVHTDACQAIVHEYISLEKLGVDMLTLDSHKMYGPRSAGIVFVKRGTPWAPVIYGGGQEGGHRAGTENVSAIVGTTLALAIIDRTREYHTHKIFKLRNHFEKKIISSSILANGFSIVCQDYVRSPHISSVLVPDGVDAEMLVLRLDVAGFSISTKSACLRDEDESYVLANIGLKGRHALRFSWGRYTTQGDVDNVVAELERVVKHFE